MGGLRSARILANPELRALFEPAITYPDQEEYEDYEDFSPAQQKSNGKRKAEVLDEAGSSVAGARQNSKSLRISNCEQPGEIVAYTQETIPEDLKKCKPASRTK